MAWWIQPLEIADENGNPTGRFRMTATSDEDGGGPFGDTSHDHASAEEAQACDRCDEYCARISGFPPRKERGKANEPTEAQIHDVLFDGYSVMSALSEQAKARTSAENVSDVLDAVVRVLRAALAAKDK